MTPMDSWIDRKSAQLKSQQVEQDKKAKQEKKAVLHKQALGAAAVDELELTVRHDIDRWNELNPGYRRRIDGVTKLMPSGAFRVCKTSYPPASVEAVLDPESFVVTVETTTTPSDRREPRIASGHFVLAPAKYGYCLTLQPGQPLSFADASRALLEPIIESMR